MKAGRSVPPVSASSPTKSLEVPTCDIQPDEQNRPIDETDEEFLELVDSVRVLGVLQRVHVRPSPDGRYVLVDGERRWRASLKAGRETIPCEVWPDDSHPRDAKLAGVILNEQRKAHGSLHVARRLRQIKNEFGETQEDLAARTGIALARVKSYLALFGASDCLLEFFANQDLPLRVACEFMRYEKAVGEAPARRLAKEYGESPITFRELVRLRKRHESPTTSKEKKADEPSSTIRARRRPRFGDRVEAAFRADRDAAIRELEEVAARLGLKVTIEAVGR
jgi:ParB family transcriptional regulator, chromosome partitioning protein